MYTLYIFLYLQSLVKQINILLVNNHLLKKDRILIEIKNIVIINVKIEQKNNIIWLVEPRVD